MLLGAAFVAPSASYAADISYAEMAATTCFICHGAEGKFTNGSMPPLAGYPEQFMAMRLKAYKNGELKGTIMQRHMKGYSDAEIDALAKYFGSLKP